MNYEEKLIKEYNKQKHKEEVKSGHDNATAKKEKLNSSLEHIFSHAFRTFFQAKGSKGCL
jgi:hypothetical protein